MTAIRSDVARGPIRTNRILGGMGLLARKPQHDQVVVRVFVAADLCPTALLANSESSERRIARHAQGLDKKIG